jgi:hypothetical protein
LAAHVAGVVDLLQELLSVPWSWFCRRLPDVVDAVLRRMTVWIERHVVSAAGLKSSLAMILSIFT